MVVSKLHLLEPSAVADNRISRRIFVRRKSRRQKYSAEYHQKKIRPVHVGC